MHVFLRIRKRSPRLFNLFAVSSGLMLVVGVVMLLR